MTWLHFLVAISISLLSTHSHLPCKVHSLYHITPFLSYKKSVICRLSHTDAYDILHIIKGCRISCTTSLRTDSLVLFFLTLPLFMPKRVVSHLPGSIWGALTGSPDPTLSESLISAVRYPWTTYTAWSNFSKVDFKVPQLVLIVKHFTLTSS